VSGAQRHPFLDDLAQHVTLASSILRRPVSGREQVLKIVKAGASLYLEQTPQFLGSVDGRTFFEYTVGLTGGGRAAGLVSIVRDAGGEVTDLNITFSPLGAVLALAAGVRERLSGECDADLFL
jgi:hypothetical protein